MYEILTDNFYMHGVCLPDPLHFLESLSNEYKGDEHRETLLSEPGNVPKTSVDLHVNVSMYNDTLVNLGTLKMHIK